MSGPPVDTLNDRVAGEGSTLVEVSTAVAVSAYVPFGSVPDSCQPVVVTRSFTRVASTTEGEELNVPFGWSQAPVVVF